MSLREWLIIIGALIILGVLLDGVRRMLRARRDAREFSRGMGSSDIGDSPLDEGFNPELPNGGSRVIVPGFDSGEEGSTPPPRQQREPTQYRPTRPVTAGPRAASWTADNETASEPAVESPVVSEHVGERAESNGTDPADHTNETDTDTDGAPLPHPQRVSPPLPDDDMPYQPEGFTAEQTEVDSDQAEDAFDSNTDTYANFSAAPDERSDPIEPPGSSSPVDDLAQSAKTLWNKLRSSAQSVTQAVEKKTVEREEKAFEQPSSDTRPVAEVARGETRDVTSKAPLAGANRPAAEEVIVINVHCKGDDRLPGPALKRLFEGCGLEYGDMGIYHRHEEPDTRSPVQFSVANAVSPGTFRPEEMSAMNSPGISFFLSLPGPDDAMQAFEFMLETAQTVVRNLGGELRDEQRSVMTGQTIEHCRQCIREYERRRHFAR